MTYPPQDVFDYVIVMGFMDYMPDPEKVVAKVLSLTRNKAFFSFPVAGGMLGWQRQIALQEALRPVSLHRTAAEADVRQLSRGDSENRAHQPRLLRDPGRGRRRPV